MTNFARRSSLCHCLVLLLAVALLLPAACKTTKPDDQTSADTAKTKKKPPVPSIPDQNGDTTFIAFMGRLRKAIAARDYDAIAEMMTPDFGYLLDPTPDDTGSGKGVFAYWDKQNVWPELDLVMQEHFVPYGDYMVAPPEFATQQSDYHGYRAGIQLVNGGWKFAYFVKPAT